MAQRLRNRKVNSEVVQGPHSFVTVKRITLEEARLMREQSRTVYVPDPTLDDEQNALKLKEFEDLKETEARKQISQFILEWDWVDDEGREMPQPHNNPDAFSKLTDLEWTFLQGALTDTSDLEKKPPSKKG